MSFSRLISFNGGPSPKKSLSESFQFRFISTIHPLFQQVLLKTAELSRRILYFPQRELGEYVLLFSFAKDLFVPLTRCAEEAPSLVPPGEREFSPVASLPFPIAGRTLHESLESP